MNLYILRHGEAENFAVSDSSRALTPQGETDVLNVAAQFAQQNVLLDHCFASPYLRAQQTASLFTSQLPVFVKVETKNELCPATPLKDLIKFLDSENDENILLVSHNPLLTELYAMLCRGDLEDLKIISTAELNEISMEILGYGQGSKQLNLRPLKQ